MTHRVALLAGALLGWTGVAAGAFGAHALRPELLDRGTLDVWETGVHYHLVHAVALVGLAGWMRLGGPSRAARWAGRAAWCWVAGALLFSVSLYLLAIGGPAWIGPITPLGGALLLLGWAFLMVAAWPRNERPGE